MGDTRRDKGRKRHKETETEIYSGRGAERQGDTERHREAGGEIDRDREIQWEA